MASVFHLLPTFIVPVFLWGLPEALSAVTQAQWITVLTILPVSYCCWRVFILRLCSWMLCQQPTPCFGDESIQGGDTLLRVCFSFFPVGLQDRDQPLKGRAVWDHPQPLPSSQYLMFLWWKDLGVGVLEVRGDCVAGHQQSPYPFVVNSPHCVWMQKLICWVFLALAASVILIKHC